MTDKAIQLLDHNGDPVSRTAFESSMPSTINSQFASYIQSLYHLDASPLVRARKPMQNHAWVFIAAMIRAVNFAQAPLCLYRETEETVAGRRRIAVQRDGKWAGPKAGKRRTAVQRHFSLRSNPSRYRGFRVKALEEDFEHPVSTLLQRPNPYMSQSDMLQLTSIWLSLRGECIWLGIMEDGSPVPIGGLPDELWVVSPDAFEPHIVAGRLMGWWLKTSPLIPRGNGFGQRVPLMLHEVIQFKYPNPENPFRGITPITAAAASINMDLMADQRNNAMLANGADPGGILAYDGSMEDEDQEDFLNKWEDRHRGPQRTNRPAIIQGSWKYIQTGITPRDMEYLESKRWNRETVFGIMRVPKSVAGITDDLNYATQVGQDKNLWDKSLLPDGRLVENTLDSTLMFDYPDDVVAGFDYSNVPALRHGLSEQIDDALKLMDNRAHMPPREAFEMVGISDLPEYEGDDVALVGLSNVPLSDVLADPDPEDPAPPAPPIPPSDDTPPEEGDDPDSSEAPAEDEPVEERGPAIRSSKTRKARNLRAWRNFIAAQVPVEKTMRRNWRGWIRTERDLQLEAFDQAVGDRATRGLTKNALVDAILLPVNELEKRIGAKFKPSYVNALEATYELTVSEVGGVAVFEIDDPRLLEVFERRLSIIKGSVPATIQSKIRKSMLDGLIAGEDFQSLRQRMADVFRLELGSAKALQVARTESAGFMNMGRDEMFGLQGFTKMEWVTAGDEHVRDSHTLFGTLGPKDRGFNYLQAENYSGDGSGVLRYPGDPDASANEVVNCRCVRVPSE